jgi:uncharacterized protein (TIGR02268 family)
MMHAVFPAAVLVLALITLAAEAAEPALPECDAPKLHVDLSPESTGKAVEVCVNPDFPTTFKFGSPLPPGTTVDVQPENRFAESRGPEVLTFIPREDYLPGERVKVTVRFGDGASPAIATFVLAGHPARAVSQVQVFRHARPVEVCQQEAREARAEARRCEQENARLRAEGGMPDGLRGMFDAELMDDNGVSSRDLTGRISERENNALEVQQAVSYRSTGLKLRGRVAVRVLLKNPSANPWTVAGAALMGPKGEELKPLPLWHTGPIHMGEAVGRVVVEFEAAPTEARGTYTLKLWDAEGRTAAIGRVTFP